MKNFKLVSVIFLMSSWIPVLAQNFTITTKEPAFDIIEWKGFGAMLLSRDGGNNDRQITMTLIGDQNTSIWDQKFIPRNDDYYYIAADNQRYVYFMDNLELDNGKFFFSQLSSAGNIKTTSVSVSSVIKKLGSYDPNELELKNIVVTDKALVHIFRYHDKKEKVYTEIATFMTHHNMLVYATVLGSASEDLIKSGRSGNWKYAGFSGDKILFTAREDHGKNKGWALKEFNSKGALQDSRFIEGPAVDFEAIVNTGYGTTGSSYVNSDLGIDRGVLNLMQERVFVTGVHKEGGESVVEVFELIDAKWKSIGKQRLSVALNKKVDGIGTYPLNEGMSVMLKSGKSGEVYFLPNDQKHQENVFPYSKESAYNPSRALLSGKKEQFALTLPGAELYFDKTQLNKEKSVEFEWIKR